MKPKGTILADRVVIDCQWKALWQRRVCLIVSCVFADFVSDAEVGQHSTKDLRKEHD